MEKINKNLLFWFVILIIASKGIVNFIKDEKNFTGYYFALSEGDSMCPNQGKLGINFFKQVKNPYNLKIGDIVDYKTNMKLKYKGLVHRIKAVYENYFYIKGDNIMSIQENVPKQNIIGKQILNINLQGCN